MADIYQTITTPAKPQVSPQRLAPLSYASAEKPRYVDDLFKSAIQFGLMCSASWSILELIALWYMPQDSESREAIPYWVMFFIGQFITVWWTSTLVLGGLWLNCLLKKRFRFISSGRIAMWAAIFPVVAVYYQCLPPDMQDNSNLTVILLLWVFIYPVAASFWICQKQHQAM